MPRVVDHAARRAEVTAALWRVVRRSGIHAVSVRSVAAEAGMSPSSMRHYFASQDELLGFGLQSMVARVEERLLPLLPTLVGRRGAWTILEQLLPLDEDRQAETEVYLAFIGRAHTDAQLRRIRDEADAGTRRAIRHAVALLGTDGALGAGRSADDEADRLHAVLDGLAMHGALMPERYPPRHQRRVLRSHLDELAGPRIS